MPKLIEQKDNGDQQEYTGVETSAGAASAGEFPTLNPAGKLDPSLMPDGVGADIVSISAAESISAGDYIYVTSAGEVAKADASDIAKKAIGFAIESAAASAAVKVQFDDSNTFLSGLTPGAVYFLSDATAGAVTTTAPTASGAIVQQVGVALNATTIHSDISATPVIRA